MLKCQAWQSRGPSCRRRTEQRSDYPSLCGAVRDLVACVLEAMLAWQLSRTKVVAYKQTSKPVQFDERELNRDRT
jgi:hypothetical protein